MVEAKSKRELFFQFHGLLVGDGDSVRLVVISLGWPSLTSWHVLSGEINFRVEPFKWVLRGIDVGFVGGDKGTLPKTVIIRFNLTLFCGHTTGRWWSHHFSRTSLQYTIILIFFKNLLIYLSISSTYFFSLISFYHPNDILKSRVQKNEKMINNII